MGSDPLVIHTEAIDDDARRWLAERTELVDARPGEPDFEARASDATGLLVRTYTLVDTALLDRMPALQVVARAGVGLDNIDLPACRERGIKVVYTPDANTQAVAEYVLAIALDATRPRTFLREAVELDTWKQMRATLRGERQLDESTIGILGLGRIGKRVARMFTGIGARVIYTDLLEIPEADRAGALPVEESTLFKEADILTIHVDGRPENKAFLDDSYLDLLGPEAILLNTSRGFVINNEHLVAFLRRNPGARAYLDVHEPEPPPPDSPFFQLENAHIAPHLASRTNTALRRMSDVVEDIWRVLQGEEPTWPAPGT